MKNFHIEIVKKCYMAENKLFKSHIKRLKLEKDLTQAEVAERLGVKSTYLSDMINGRVPVTESVIGKIYEVFSYKIPFGDETEESASSKSVVSYTKGRPYYNVDFIGGFDLVTNNQTINPEYYIDFPPYNKDGIMWCNITGRSMEPQIGHGDIIALKEVVDWQSYLSYGEVYAIVTHNDLRTVKIVRKGSDANHIRLVPINTEEFDEQEIEKSMIMRIYAVVGCIKKM